MSYYEINLFDSNKNRYSLSEDTIISAEVDLESNSAGNANIKIPNTHKYYDKPQIYFTGIEIYESGKKIFFGPVVEITRDWNNDKTISADGALSFLNLSVLPYQNYRPFDMQHVDYDWTDNLKNTSIKDIFKGLISYHNTAMGSNAVAKLYPGKITVTDKIVSRDVNYDNIYSALKSFCINPHGGYMVVRYEDDKTYVDWLKKLTDTNTRDIQYSINLLDLEQNYKMVDVCTVLIATTTYDLIIYDADTGEYIETKKEPLSVTITANSDLIKKYGRIKRQKEFEARGEGVDNIRANLIEDGTTWLKSQQIEPLTLRIDAAELHILDNTGEPYRIGNKVKVVSNPHMITYDTHISKIHYNLLTGKKDITLGDSYNYTASQLLGRDGSEDHYTDPWWYKDDPDYMDPGYYYASDDTLYADLDKMKTDGMGYVDGNTWYRDSNSYNNWHYPLGYIVFPNYITDIEAYINNNIYPPNSNRLSKIIFPNSVTDIGPNAFWNCFNATEITIPNSVKNIGKYAFFSCNNATEITIGSSVTNIEDGAFFRCSNVKEITIPNSVTNISAGIFGGCISVTNITIPNSVTYIGNGAFADCKIISNITIPDSITYIGGTAFQNCRNTTEITIPDSVTYIGQWAFQNCLNATEITIGSSVTYIGNNAFGNCRNATEITIGSSVTIIDWDAFQNCINVTSITIPNSVINIVNYAFDNCRNATEITIGNSVTNICYRAFGGCYSANVLCPGNATIDSHAFYGAKSITYY